MPAIGDISRLPLDKVPAKKLFAAKRAPADLKARSIGFYSRGCLAGGQALADQRTGLAGDAPVAQPQLGSSEADRTRSSNWPTRRD